MSSPVNPILVIKNNLPDYRDELIHERAELQMRLNEIDEEIATLYRLETALVPPSAVNTPSFTPVGDACGRG